MSRLDARRQACADSGAALAPVRIKLRKVNEIAKEFISNSAKAPRKVSPAEVLQQLSNYLRIIERRRYEY
jgi:hypothetical protein